MDLKAGYLAKYARNSGEKKTHSFTTKVTEQEHEEFRKYAACLGLTTSEALRFLIIEELARVKKEIFSYPEVSTTDTKVSTVDTLRYESISSDPSGIPLDPPQIPKPKPKKPRPRSSSGGRFDTIQWQVNGKTACPICKTWQSASNFSRHLRTQHDGITAREVFENPEYREIADRMVKEGQS